MSRKKLRRAIPDTLTGRRYSRCRAWLVALALSLPLGCGRQVEEPVPPPPVGPTTELAADEFSVMTFNLGGYGYLDRSGDGQATEFKPESEREAVLTILADTQPQILALQDIAGGDTFTTFREALAERGLSYPFIKIAETDAPLHVALLSQYPLTSTRAHTDDRYSIGDDSLPVQRGFLEADIAINPAYSFRLFVVQLKSKAYHPSGHTEMRRNEARLLHNHIRQALDNEHRLNLLIVGSFNDHPGSAPMRQLIASRRTSLYDLRLTDSFGETWTFVDRDQDAYYRYDYLLASPHMLPEFVPQKSQVVRHPLNQQASLHRPLMAVFRARDLPTDGVGLLPDYELDDE